MAGFFYGVDWQQYSGSPWYNPEKVAPNLKRLANLSNKDEANSVADLVLSTIGNNHAGTFYPAIELALNIIIMIAEQRVNLVSKQCAMEILGDLNCFKADLEGYAKTIDHKLEAWVSERVKRYDL